MYTETVKMGEKVSIQKTVAVLKKRGVVVFPTETCYGLGTDATSKRCIEKIYEIKGRDRSKKMAAAFSSLKMAEKYTDIGRNERILAKKFMPGPLTIVKKGKSFRIPDNDFVLSVIRNFGKPITVTSANRSGEKELYRIKDVVKEFSGTVDLIVDAGNLRKRRPSTVFDMDSMRILRKGPIGEEKIRRAILYKSDKCN